MELVKKQWSAKEKSQIEKITIQYEDGTERTIESGLVVTFDPSPEARSYGWNRKILPACNGICLRVDLAKHFTSMISSFRWRTSK
nr:MAG TPA: hypothetical protein [Caudoviricetes sp.]